MNNVFYLSHYVGPVDPEPILRDAFNGWLTGNGIFDALAAVADLPWKDAESVDSSILDVAYFGNHSGGKFCSPLVKMLIDEDDGEVPAAGRAVIAKIIISKYLINWNNLWATNVASYSPIANYDMTEVRDLETNADNIEVVDQDAYHTGTDSMLHGMVETTQHGMSDTTVNSRYGLNTVQGSVQPSDQTVDQQGGTTVVTDSGTDTNTKNLQDSTDVRTVEDNNGTEHEEIRRSGNIGVTTTQKLLQEERELWLWNFFDEIFKDLDKELALAFHDPCRV